MSVHSLYFFRLLYKYDGVDSDIFRRLRFFIYQWRYSTSLESRVPKFHSLASCSKKSFDLLSQNIEKKDLFLGQRSKIAEYPISCFKQKLTYFIVIIKPYAQNSQYVSP